MAKQQKNEVSFEEVAVCGCGLDVHKKEIVATVSGTDIRKETRTFQSTTGSLTQLKEWLLELRVTHVAMESTGVTLPHGQVPPPATTRAQVKKVHTPTTAIRQRRCVVCNKNKGYLLL